MSFQFALVDSFAWESLGQRFQEHPPRLSIGLVYCERPSRDERARMMKAADEITIGPSSSSTCRWRFRLDASYDIARKLVALADQKRYEAKRSFADSTDPHIAQINVRIVNGRLTDFFLFVLISSASLR